MAPVLILQLPNVYEVNLNITIGNKKTDRKQYLIKITKSLTTLKTT